MTFKMIAIRSSLALRTSPTWVLAAKDFTTPKSLSEIFAYWNDYKLDPWPTYKWLA